MPRASIDRLCGRWCSRYARALNENPKCRVALPVVALCLIAVAAVGCFLLWHTESALNSFVDPDDPVVLQASRNRQLFGPNPRYETFILTAKDVEATPLASKAALSALFKVRDAVLGLRASSSNATYQDICYSMYNDGMCSTMIATDFWKSEADMLADPAPMATMACSPCFNPTTLHALVPQYVLGSGYTRNETAITSVPAYINTFMVHPDGASFSAGSGAVEDWEVAFESLLASLRAGLPEYNLYYNTEGSLLRQVEKETSADIPIIMASYAAMTAYMALIVQVWKSKRRLVLLLCTFVGALGALVLGVFLGLCFGLPLSPLVFEGLPFLVLALSVDAVCQFLSILKTRTQSSLGWQDASLTSSDTKGCTSSTLGTQGIRQVYNDDHGGYYDGDHDGDDDGNDNRDDEAPQFHGAHHDQGAGAPPMATLLRAFRVVGATIPFAATVEAAAFAAGCIVPAPAIRSLCAYAAICTVSNAAMAALLLLPVLVWEAQGAGAGAGGRRVTSAAASLNGAGSAPRLRGVKEEGPAFDAASASSTASSTSASASSSPLLPPAHSKGTAAGTRACACACCRQRRMSRRRCALAAALSALFLGVVIGDAVLLSRGVPVHFNQSDLVAADSFIAEFLGAQSRHLGIGPPVYADVVDLPAAANQGTVKAVAASVRASRHIDAGVGVFDWFGDVEWWYSHCRGGPGLPTHEPAFSRLLQGYFTMDCLDLCNGCPLLAGSNATCPPSLPPGTPGCEYPWGICTGAACQLREIHKANVLLPVASTGAAAPVRTYRFQAYLTQMNSFDEFIGGYHAMTRLSDSIQHLHMQGPAFTTSIFMPFYTEYDTIWAWTWSCLGIAVAAAFVVVALWTSNLRFAAAATAFIVTPLLSGVASLSLASGLNTSTLVNTAIAVGLCMETFIHSLKQIMVHKRRPVDAVKSILLGMWATKVLGAAMLLFAHCRLTSQYFLQPVLVVLGVSGLEWLLLLSWAPALWPRRFKGSDARTALREQTVAPRSYGTARAQP